MKRPLFYAAVIFASGLITGYYLRLSLVFLGLILISGLLLLLFLKEYSRYILVFFLIFMTGFLYLNWQEVKYNSPFSISSWNEKGIKMVTGEVREDLSALQGNKVYLKPYYVESSRVKYGLIELDKRYLPVRLIDGDIIQIGLELRTPVKKINPGGFSNFRYLKKKGILSQGYYEKDFELVGYTNHFFRNAIISTKYRLLSIIDSTMVFPYNEILKAFLLGERENLPEDWKEGFTKAGVNHLLAISGLHVGFVLLIFLGLTGITGFPSGWRNLFISLLIIFYIMLTGLRASVLRAGILAVLFLWAPFFRRKGDLFNLLGFTILVNLIIKPYDLFQIGFQLSYLVLIMIVIWNDILKKYTGSILAVSTAAQFGSFPISSYYFNLISPIGIITNLWAIPLVGIIVSLGLIGTLLGLINPVFSLMANRLAFYLIFLLNSGIRMMTAIPLGYLEVPSPGFINVVVIYLFLLVLPFLLRKKIIPVNIRKGRRNLYIVIFTGLFLILIQIFMLLLAENELEVIFFSVGQGDAVLLNLPCGRHVLVDGGGLAGLNSSQGERVILPYLKESGIKKLDIIFITHFDTDHALGIAGLLNYRNAGLIVFPAEFTKNPLSDSIINLAGRKEIPVILTQKGDNYRLGETSFQVLNPIEGHYNNSRNANSIVLKVNYGDFDLLLTGDLEKEGEMRLLRTDSNLESEILKVSHHGSGGASTENFLKSISPDDAVISVGENNNYGHPSSSVLQRLNALHIRTWRTDKQGAIIIKTDGHKYSIKGYLDKRIRKNEL